jgi:peptidoglycan-associated lipoprotein
MMMRMAGFKTIAVMSCFLALAACSKKKNTLESGGLNPDGGNGSELSGARYAAGSEEQFKTEIGDRVYFLVDQTSLTPEGREILTRQAQWLQQYSNVTVQVEGHADERGTREYNISLSARRATATRNFLISQGVDGSRISSIAYGKERPASLCESEECWSQNRRAVTVITGGAS